MRTLVIGDIHGALRALVQVLERSNFSEKEDQLIFLGDYSDGWSETSLLIQYLIELEKNCTHKPIFLKGNHDKWVEEWLIFGIANPTWLHHGGQATFDSYLRTGYLVSDEHKNFYRNLHNYYVDDINRGFVHGGYISSKGLGHDTYESNYYWDRDLWNLAMFIDKIPNKEELLNNNKFAKFLSHKEVFIGHTTTMIWGKDKPINAMNVWNLDTGAGWDGKLTCMDIDTKKYWQSDLVKDLYTNEKGRN